MFCKLLIVSELIFQWFLPALKLYLRLFTFDISIIKLTLKNYMEVAENNQLSESNVFRFAFSGSNVSLLKKEIVRLEGYQNYTYIYSRGKKYLSSMTLKHFESILDSSQFIRTHKKHIVNKAFVKDFIEGVKSSEIRMVCGSQIEISRRRLKSVRDNF